MGCWGGVIDDLKAAISFARSFEEFIAKWGGTGATAPDHVFLHDWPKSQYQEDRYVPEELEARFRAYALLRIVPGAGYTIYRGPAINTAKIGGQIEIELARLVPHDIRDDMSAVLQQAIIATEPIIYEVMDSTDGLWQSVQNDGYPWRSMKEFRKTQGDYHGVTYLMNWGHPQGEK